ncbi:hypothetical protein HOD38_03320 [archaeon]|jgi:hypothetical protein|nr:hypothetical protein [archaeon]MBT4397270.1 hypothetical protein [archaeon]MBT4440650.1 hypothetical protein [archaeon]
MSLEYQMFPHQGSPMKTAIANTLSFLDDEELAQRVYNCFNDHRLVRGDRSILLPLVPTLIRETTEGAYNAQLFGAIDIPAITRQMITLYDGQAPVLAKLLISEIIAGNIVDRPAQTRMSLDDVAVPSICVFKTPEGAVPLVYLGDQVQIEGKVYDQVFADGETIIQLDPTAYPIVGLIEVVSNYET